MMLSAPVFAAGSLQPGGSVNYNHNYNYSLFTYDDYVGKCAQTGIPYEDNGTGTVDGRIPNTSDAAKIAYYYTYVNNKIRNNGYPSSLEGTGIAGDWSSSIGWGHFLCISRAFGVEAKRR